MSNYTPKQKLVITMLDSEKAIEDARAESERLEFEERRTFIVNLIRDGYDDQFIRVALNRLYPGEGFCEFDHLIGGLRGYLKAG